MAQIPIGVQTNLEEIEKRKEQKSVLNSYQFLDSIPEGLYIATLMSESGEIWTVDLTEIRCFGIRSDPDLSIEDLNEELERVTNWRYTFWHSYSNWRVKWEETVTQFEIWKKSTIYSISKRLEIEKLRQYKEGNLSKSSLTISNTESEVMFTKENEEEIKQRKLIISGLESYMETSKEIRDVLKDRATHLQSIIKSLLELRTQQ